MGSKAPAASRRRRRSTTSVKDRRSRPDSPISDVLEGAGILLDIQTALTWPLQEESDPRIALAGDWARIAQDMWTSILSTEKNHFGNLEALAHLTRRQLDAVLVLSSTYRFMLDESAAYREWVQELLSALPVREATELSLEALLEVISSMKLLPEGRGHAVVTTPTRTESASDAKVIMDALIQVMSQYPVDQDAEAERDAHVHDE